MSKERFVDEYEKEESAECKRCKGDCGFLPMTGQWKCHGFVPKTNADRIRQMTDEELAEWLDGELPSKPKEWWMGWLKQEVDNG